MPSFSAPRSVHVTVSSRCSAPNRSPSARPDFTRNPCMRRDPEFDCGHPGEQRHLADDGLRLDGLSPVLRDAHAAGEHRAVGHGFRHRRCGAVQAPRIRRWCGTGRQPVRWWRGAWMLRVSGAKVRAQRQQHRMVLPDLPGEVSRYLSAVVLDRPQGQAHHVGWRCRRDRRTRRQQQQTRERDWPH
jgi:hypothetical protein